MRKRLFLFVALASLLGFYGCSDKTSVIDEPEVNTSGGTFMVGDVKFEIPDGALDKEIKLTAKDLTKNLTTDVFPDEMIAAYEFGPDGTEFKKPIKVTVPLPKTVTPGKYLVTCYNPKWKIWEGVSFAEIKGNEATFEVKHFSVYSVTELDYRTVEYTLTTANNGINSGKSTQEVMNQLEQLYIYRLNMLYKWDMDISEGKATWKQPNFATIQYLYAFTDGKHLKEGQGIYSYGKGDFWVNQTHDENWNELPLLKGGYYQDKLMGYNCPTSLNFQYVGSHFELIECRDGSWEEMLTEYQNLSHILFDRHMVAIDPHIELTEKNVLGNKGDKDEIEAYMYVQHTGQEEVWNCLKSIAEGVDGDLNMEYETPDKTFEQIKFKDTEGAEGEEPKYDYPFQKLQVWVDDPDQVKICDLQNVKGEKNVYETPETSEDGKVTIKIEALKNSVNTDFHAEWEYDFTDDSPTTYIPYTEHAAAQAKLHLGSGTWTILGVITYGEYHTEDTTEEWKEWEHHDAGFDIMYGFEVGPFVADGDWMDNGTGNMCLVRTACSMTPEEPIITEGYCYLSKLDQDEDNKEYRYDFANWGTNSFSTDDRAYIYLKETKTGIKALFQYTYQNWWNDVLFWYEDRNGSKYAYPALNRIMFPLEDGEYFVEYDEDFNDNHFEECRDGVALHSQGEGYWGTLWVCKDSNNPEDIKQAKERLRKAHMAKLAKLRKSTATHAKTAPHERR